MSLREVMQQDVRDVPHADLAWDVLYFPVGVTTSGFAIKALVYEPAPAEDTESPDNGRTNQTAGKLRSYVIEVPDQSIAAEAVAGSDGRVDVRGGVRRLMGNDRFRVPAKAIGRADGTVELSVSQVTVQRREGKWVGGVA